MAHLLTADAPAVAKLTHPADVACALAGYDLHESICQHLAGTAVIAAVVAADLKNAQSPFAKKAEEVAALVADACENARKLAVALDMASAGGGGLYRALKNLAALASKSVNCRLEYPVKIEVPASVSLHLYRIAHEIVSNTLTHSGASEVLISCVADDGRLTLTVEDNGIGYNAEEFADQSGGLREISRCAHLIGGTLRFSSNAEHGTCLSCSVSLVGERSSLGA